MNGMKNRMGIVGVASLGLLAAAAWGCGGGNGTMIDTTSGSGAGRQGAGGSPSEVGPATTAAGTGGGSVPEGDCDPEGQFTCDGLELLQCLNHTRTHVETCDPTEICDAPDRTCSCAVGTARCVGGARQSCTQLSHGNQFFPDPCKSTEICVDAGDCKPKGVNQCDMLGAFTCGTDGDTILHCQPVAPDNHLELVPSGSCKAEGFENGCPATTVVGTTLTSVCMNACNRRGIALVGTLCGDVTTPGLTCATLVCNAPGDALVPDRTGCDAAGQPCQADTDCASCFCEPSSKRCEGTQTLACHNPACGT